ncbi:MAG TPA: hypothetical protein VMN36_04895 [Verrucomicrobiales bacterium]|nr:hypothetical protein [Verrucomicrobiales bacterium]
MKSSFGSSETAVAEQVGQAARAARHQVLSLLGDIRGLSREAIWAKQLRVAQCAGCVEAIALDAAAILRRNRHHRLASRADRVASTAEGAVEYLAQTPPEEVWSDTRDCVRRHPGAALAAIFVGGVMIGRFLRSSSRGQIHA